MDDAGITEPDTDVAPVKIIVRDARAVDSRVLFALVDVDLEVGGIVFSILGVQARRLPSGGTDVVLPTFRSEDGKWRPAIQLPEELQNPLITAVLLFLVEEGLTHNRLLRSFNAHQG